MRTTQIMLQFAAGAAEHHEMREPGTHTDAQRLHLALLRHASFNRFSGPRVVDDLLAHAALWDAAVMPDQSFAPITSHLDGLAFGAWHAGDTLYVRPRTTECAGALERLAERWEADEIRWEEEDHLGQRYSVPVLLVWWD